MSLFIQNNNGTIYSECSVTINNGQVTDTPQSPFEGGEKEDRCADRVQTVNTDRSAGGLTDLFTQRAEDILGIPRENKYTEVRRYIEERKRFDPEFSNYCRDHSLRSLCERLTKEFGWFVDEHSLGANLNRNR